MLSLSDRIAGGLFGLLIGDALGVPYEFRVAHEIPPFEQIEMQPPLGYQRAHSVPPGTWSDDGAQALCLLDSLLLKDELDLHDFAQRLVAWYEDGLWAIDNDVFDVGIQTSASLLAIASGMPPEKAGFVRPNGKGNGALMRVLPLALWHRGTDAQLVEDAHRQSVVTHGHLTNQVVSALYCLWARESLQGHDQADSYRIAVQSLRAIYGDSSEYRKELESTLCPDDAPVTDGTGYVVYTFNCARLALEEDSYEKVVKRAIAFGEDTDTNVAVAGGLAGILFGPQGIPERWMNTLRGRDLVAPLLERLQMLRSV